MGNVYAQILDKAGYCDMPPTLENVVECFLDYVACGVFGNIDHKVAKVEIESGEITINQICSNMLRILGGNKQC